MHQHNIPISLYIHIPWCIKKCPYCDFNSHPQRGEIPEKTYTAQLLANFASQLPYFQGRPLHSMFIGGGTPSLFSPDSYHYLFQQIKKMVDVPKDIEITLEANPGTVIPNRFAGYRDAGINRLSLGVQSFQNDKLKTLGRIHNSDQASAAIESARQAGFDNFNIDLMFGLPDQTIKDALFDLQTAIDLTPTHMSWYQLTLEPNTFFHRFPPVLPDDDDKFDIQTAGQTLLAQNDYLQYEVSAYSKTNKPCQHNLNYWQFGDYIGIGAGAHGKTTDLKTMEIKRHWQLKHPKQYLAAAIHRQDPKTNDAEMQHATNTKIITKKELPLEFMMNALRLHQSVPFELFEARTGLSRKVIDNPLQKAVDLGLICITKNSFYLTQQGKLFLNEVLELF